MNLEDDILELEERNNELQDLEDEKDMEETRKSLASYNLEGERTTTISAPLIRKSKARHSLKYYMLYKPTKKERKMNKW